MTDSPILQDNKMNIEEITAILVGMANTLKLIKQQPELQKYLNLRHFHASNDLTFEDIQQSVNEILEAILTIQDIEAKKELSEQIAKSQLNQRLIKE
jgi:hypothetical protein